MKRLGAHLSGASRRACTRCRNAAHSVGSGAKAAAAAIWRAASAATPRPRDISEHLVAGLILLSLTTCIGTVHPAIHAALEVGDSIAA